jgi:glycerophosphoryl diester phosphodiesterase
MPASRFSFFDIPPPIAFAHQGGAKEFPENTLKAFQGSVALGYRYLETDVHATKDNVVIVMHDDTLDRTTDHTGLIADLPWSVVKEAKVNGTEPIPRFDEVLAALPDTRFNVEPKTTGAVEPLIEVLRAAGALDRVCVGSFQDARLRTVRKALGAELATGMGIWTTVRLWVGSLLPRFLGRLLARTPAACTQVPVKKGPVTVVTKRFIGLAHDLGMEVHVWTIDDADEMRRLLDLGVDGIMTDAPSVLKQVLVERGAWPTA